MLTNVINLIVKCYPNYNNRVRYIGRKCIYHVYFRFYLVLVWRSIQNNIVLHISILFVDSM